MAKQTVLLVDADTKSARVLEVSLRKAGYSVTLVKSAAEAVDAIEIATPDLVLSDTRLAPPSTTTTSVVAAVPVDGYQLCRRLKDDPVWYSIPFIFLTSSSSIEDKIRGLELGVEDYLTKPIYIKEILTRIQLVLAKKQREGMEGRTSRASFTGLLSEMGLVDLLSTIDLGRKSGVLDIEGTTKATVFFRDGRVVEARCGRYTGAAAIYRMLVWNEGRFEIRFGPCPVEDTVDMSTQGLLMEGMRRLDEWQRLQEQLPSLDAVYEVDTKELAARIGEIPDEVNQILRAFNGERTLIEVVDESGFDDLGALATLSKLYFEGLIIQRLTHSGTEGLEGEDGTGLVPGGAQDEEEDRVATSEGGVLVDSIRPPPPSIPPPPMTPTGTQWPVGSAGAGTFAASGGGPQNKESDRESSEGSPGGRALSYSGQLTAASSDAQGREERDVAKHRGKRKRSKRELLDDVGTPPNGNAAAAGGAPAALRDESPSVPPAPPEAKASDDKPRDRVDSNVIQFPKSPGASSERAEATTATAEAQRPGVPTTPPATEAEAKARKADAPTDVPAVTKRAEPPPPPPQAKTEAKKAEPPPPPKTEAKKADTSQSKMPPPPPPAAKRNETPPATQSVAPPPPKDDRNRQSTPGSRKSEPGEKGRDRKISFSHELGEDAKAFFHDKSYEATYKHVHDTFEDLKSEETHEHHSNRRSMLLTGGLVVLLIAVVGGFWAQHRIFGVQVHELPVATPGIPVDPRPPEATAASASPTESAPAPRPQAAPAPSAPAAAQTAAGSAPTAPTATTTAAETPTTAPVAPAAAPAAPTAAPEAAPAAAGNTTVPPTVAAAPPATEPTAAPPTVAAQPPAPTPAPAVAPAVATAPPAAGGGNLPDLLHAAQRARTRGETPAAAAYQTWFDAGGRDGAAMANFAYWLANDRGSLGRAGDWAQRASVADPTNQLAWYVLGVAKMDGPHPDRTVGRDALRHCVALPGQYTGECRGAM